MSTRNKRKTNQGAVKSLDQLQDPYILISECGKYCLEKDHLRKKNCVNNPWCLHGMTIAKDSIWNKDGGCMLSTLGPNPARCLRNLVDGRLIPPCGLRNLGATCYLNALIQSLLHNVLILGAVYNMDPEGSGDEPQCTMRKVVSALQDSFAHMSRGLRGVYDIRKIVDLLGLDRGEQQDLQEFHKLFFARIEALSLPTHDASFPPLNELVSGQEEHRTVCTDCGSQSAQCHAFHELGLSIEGKASLEEALAGYFAPEQLCGDNQYFCQACGGLRDATRYTALTSLPAVLCIQLLRYAYDKRSLARRKLQSDLIYPDSLVLNGEVYVLVAVCYHKGRSAHGGHYVSDVLEWSCGQWWHCDDESIFRTDNPAEHIANSPVSSSNGSNGGSSGSKDTPQDDATAEDPDWLEAADRTTGKKSRTKTGMGRSVAKKQKGVDGTSSATAVCLDDETLPVADVEHAAVSSAFVNRKRDAYMLSYVRRSDFERARAAARSHPPRAPEMFIAGVDDSSAEFLREIAQYQQCRDLVLERVATRKSNYQAFLSSVPETPPEAAVHYVPAEWLLRWAQGHQSTFPSLEADCRATGDYGGGKQYTAGPPVLGPRTHTFLCEHGVGMNLKFLGQCKVLSDASFQAVFSREPGLVADWDFTSDNLRCEECFEQSVSGNSKINDNVGAVRRVVALTELPLENGSVGATQYRVSRPWLTQFRKLAESLELSLEGRGRRSPADILTLMLGGVNREGSDGADSSVMEEGTEDHGAGGDPGPVGVVVVDLRNEDVPLTDGTSVTQPQITDWLASSSVASSKPLDSSVNRSLRCEHDRYDGGGKSCLVSAEAWEAISSLYPLAIDLPATDEPCPVCLGCQESARKAADLAKQLRLVEAETPCLARLNKARRVYPPVLDSEEVYSSTGGDYCDDVRRARDHGFVLVEAQWVARWREYLKNRNSPRPSVDSLRHAPSLRCRHGLALVPPELLGVSMGIPPGQHSPGNLAVEAHGAVSKSTCLPRGELLTYEQWIALNNLHTGHSAVDFPNDVITTRLDCVVVEPPEPISLTWRAESDSWCWSPASCERCWSDLADRDKQSIRVFSAASLTVKVFRDEAKLREVFAENAGETVPIAFVEEGNIATSRPTRRCRRAFKTHTVHASSSDTLGLLLMRLLEEANLDFGMHRIFSATGTEYDCAQLTLEQCGIRSTDILYALVVGGDGGSQTEGGDDLMFLFHENGAARAKETGFGESLLLDGATSVCRKARSVSSRVVDLAQSEEEVFQQQLVDALRASETEQ